MTEIAKPEAAKPTYKIIGLIAENVKRLKIVSIQPDGNLIEITGKNEAGKSSVLDAIWWALTGTSHIQASPIRKGQEKARIELNLGMVVVTRKFSLKEDNGYTTSLTVATPDGMLAQKPQEFLKAIVDELTMDPLEFARAKPREQFDALKALVPGVDFVAIEAANKADFDARTDINREAKAAETRAAAIQVPEGTPDEWIDEEALLGELESVSRRNTELGDLRQARATRQARVTRLDAEEISYRNQAVDYRRLADEAEAEAKRVLKEAADLSFALQNDPEIPAPVDPSEIATRISHARAVNANVSMKARKVSELEEAAQKTKRAAELTAGIETRNEEKRKAIAAAELPIPGLSLGEDSVTLNGLPFDQASDAVRLKTSIAIAMARHPRLKVLRIRDGSLLDSDSVKLVAEMADAYDCQVWIESVDSKRAGAIVLEDGGIVGIEQMAAAE